MENQNPKIELLQSQFRDMLQPEKAAIFGDSVGILAQYRVVTFALDTAKLSTQPFKIGFPFRAFQAYTATNTDVEVFIKPSSQDDSQDWISVKQNYSLEFPFPVREGYMYWAAQASKSISIIFLLNGRFQTNQFVQTSQGGFTLADGTAVTPQSPITASITATQIVASSSSRKVAVVQNNDSIPVFISGDNTVTDDAGLKPGIKINPGESYEWRSSSAIFLISSSAGATGKIGINIFS